MKSVYLHVFIFPKITIKGDYKIGILHSDFLSVKYNNYHKQLVIFTSVILVFQLLEETWHGVVKITY